MIRQEKYCMGNKFDKCFNFLGYFDTLQDGYELWAREMNPILHSLIQ